MALTACLECSHAFHGAATRDPGVENWLGENAFLGGDAVMDALPTRLGVTRKRKKIIGKKEKRKKGDKKNSITENCDSRIFRVVNFYNN